MTATGTVSPDYGVGSTVRTTVFLAVAFLFVGSASAQELSAKQIAQATFPSTVLLLMQDSDGQPSVLGSGFFVADNLIATNFHVIEGAAKGYARLVGQATRLPIIGVAAVDEARDLALLAVNAKAPALHLATTAAGPPGGGDIFDKISKPESVEKDSVEIGDPVYAVGNPEGLEGTFSQGLVSGIRHIDADTLLQITAPISPGSSGGPVLNSKGYVVGIAVATFTEGQNLNFAVPVAYLATLLRNAKQPLPLSRSEQAPSRSRSIMEGLGGDSRDGIKAGQFLWVGSPNEEFTFSLRNQLGDAVSNVSCIVIFYDKNKQPIESKLVRFDDTIPPGLAKRVHGYGLDESVFDLVECGKSGCSYPRRAEDPQSGAVEFRILDFRVVK